MFWIAVAMGLWVGPAILLGFVLLAVMLTGEPTTARAPNQRRVPARRPALQHLRQHGYRNATPLSRHDVATAVDMTLRKDNAGALPTCPHPPQHPAVLVV
jgi:hypothetical protein